MKKWVGLLVACVALAGCDLLGITCGANHRPPDRTDRVSVRQGIWGQVWLWEGNFQPSTGGCTSGRVSAVSRMVYIYEATPDSMTRRVGYGAFFSQVRTPLVDSIRSDRDGFFEAELPPGTYSLLVRVDSLLYANRWSGPPPDGLVQPAVVPPNDVVRMQLDLDYNKVE